MIIAITGTPSTGKTLVAKELAKTLKAKLVQIKSLVAKHKIPTRFDKRRDTRIVDADKLRRAVKKEVVKGINIVEGHLSHFVDADLYVILRCRPDVLEKRMKKRGWARPKIDENLHAEILDVITIETREIHRKKAVVEIDTSSKNVRSIASLIADMLNNHRLQSKYRPGKVDWSMRFSKYLLAADYEVSA